MPNAPTARRGRIAQLRAMIGRILAGMLGVTSTSIATPATLAIRRYGRMNWQPPKTKAIMVVGGRPWRNLMTSATPRHASIEMRPSHGYIAVQGMMDTYLGRRRRLNRDLIAGRERRGDYGSKELAAMPMRVRSSKAQARLDKKAAVKAESMFAMVMREVAERTGRLEARAFVDNGMKAA